MEQHVADVACFVALFNGASDAPLSHSRPQPQAIIKKTYICIYICL